MTTKQHIHNRLADVPEEALQEMDALILKWAFLDASGFAVYKGPWTDQKIVDKLNEKWAGFMGLCTDGTPKKFTINHVKTARQRLLGNLRTQVDRARETQEQGNSKHAINSFIGVEGYLHGITDLLRRYAEDLAVIKQLLAGGVVVGEQVQARMEANIDALQKQTAIGNDVADYLTRTTDYKRPEYGPTAALLLGNGSDPGR